MDASKLEGAALDIAVARALGYPVEHTNDGEGWVVVREGFAGRFNPSTSWEQGGPIIERERITIVYGVNSTGSWEAWHGPVSSGDLDGDAPASGPTPLIAAMRAFCASKGTAP